MFAKDDQILFRLPAKLKDEFRNYCDVNDSSMSDMLCTFIKTVIADEYRNMIEEYKANKKVLHSKPKGYKTHHGTPIPRKRRKPISRQARKSSY